MAHDELLPHSIEAEQSTLGSMLLDRAAIEKIGDVLKPSDFYRPAHAEIFDAICSLSARDEPVDLITLQEELRAVGRLEAVGGTEYLMSLISQVPSAARIAHYGAIVKDRSVARRQIGLCSKITSAIKSGEEVGAWLRELDEMSSQKISAALLPAINFVEAATSNISVSWIVDQLIPAGGITMVSGDPGVGKTWLAMALGLNVAMGIEFCGRKTTVENVLYLDLEAGDMLLRDRAAKLWLGLETEAREFYNDVPLRYRLLYDSLDLYTDAGLSLVAGDLVASNTGLLIIDPFNQAFRGDENSATDAAEWFLRLRRLRDKTGATIVIIHHSRKRIAGLPNDAGQMLRGSSAIRAALDSHICLRRIGDASILVEHEKNRFGMPSNEFSVMISPRRGGGVAVEFVGSIEAIEATQLVAAMKDITGRLADGLEHGRKDLFALLSTPERTSFRALSELVDSGKVLKIKRGKTTFYTLNSSIFAQGEG